ncbi:hypothetical protein OS493_031037 [Desmophyllum pertusum]|uniref:Uncharacterized protein n=1 Tax=Desmophyllum pertusum TaxID=174260 RepID=A0A9W9YW82_9CNID|nr:hypothetical protein OS493_031037 [Desmophyllum pertusum]
MGSVRCYALRCAAVVLLSSVFFMLYLITHKEHDQEAFEDYWSFLSLYNHVSYCHMLGIHKVTIHWKNCQSSCTKDPQKNSWPAYFEPLNAGTELTADKVLCLGGSIAGRVLVSESTRTFMRSNTQQNEQFNFMFTRTSSLLEVGFRKRQSLPGYEQDHWAEMEDQTLPTMEKWIQDAEALFGTMKEPKKIFLASDNDEIVGRFVEHFGENKVIYTAAIRANKYHSNHPINGVFTNDTDPIEIGSQVLIDILLLAKCGHFLHAESSVATLVSFFNPEMKLSFLGNLDMRVKDGDFKQKPFPDSSEESEIEWEEGWGDQIQSLAWCFQANGPYSACPNMAKGQLIDSKEVRTFLAQ